MVENSLLLNSPSQN